MKRPRPLLSVVIPTWNRAGLVCKAVASALAQAPDTVEVIVVDDGSSDNTAGLLGQRFGSRITLLRHTHRAGVGAARNTGVRRANGELLAFLDSDDLWLPGKLAAELNVFERFPNADAVISDNLNFLNGRPRDPGSRFKLNGLLAATRRQVRWNSDCDWLWTNAANSTATCSITLHRRALARLGQPLFAEDLLSCEDWELELRLYQQCRVAVLPEIWSHVHCFDDNSRPGRATPGTPPTPAQHRQLQCDRLSVIDRSCHRHNLNAKLAAELDRFRAQVVRELATASQRPPLCNRSA